MSNISAHHHDVEHRCLFDVHVTTLPSLSLQTCHSQNSHIHHRERRHHHHSLLRSKSSLHLPHRVQSLSLHCSKILAPNPSPGRSVPVPALLCFCFCLWNLFSSRCNVIAMLQGLRRRRAEARRHHHCRSRDGARRPCDLRLRLQ